LTVGKSIRMKELIKKIDSRDAVLGVVGLGYVGLPLALSCLESGFSTIGFDIDTAKVDLLRAGASYIKSIPSDRISSQLDGRFDVTTDFSRIRDVDAIIICVPTPLDLHRDPDVSFIQNTLESIRPFLKPGQVVSLESTTYPGTTEEMVLPVVNSISGSIGEDYFVVYSPEREDPGNKNYNTSTIPKIVGGVTESCTYVGERLYRGFISEVVTVSSTRVAEMTKLLENIHRAVNIGLVNEMKIVADSMGIDIFEVIRAASTKPFGFTPYFPGPGLGGHCIPIDPFYLTWKAREYGVHTRFIELAGEVNASMPQWVFRKVVSALNSRQKSVYGSRVLVLGIAYKKNVDDARESPALRIMELLAKNGAIVSYSDPHFPVFPKMRDFHFKLESVPLVRESLQAYDLILVATDHEEFNFDEILSWSSLIVDTRGVYPVANEKVLPA